MLEAIITTLGLTVLGGFGWIIQLGNRVTIVETKQDGIAELINTRFDEVNRRLARIEAAMNGHLSTFHEE